jgi:hypothetical protein
MSTPKVFISYSHDSQEHKQWVLELATRLRNNGIDAALDQWDLKPGDDLPHFMEQNLSTCDFALMVCTEAYVEKANKGTGGVGYEKMILTAELLSQIDNNKVIPLIRQKGKTAVPTFLKTKLYIDFSYHKDVEFSFDELLRTVHQAPLFKKPEIGNTPFEKVKTQGQDRANDPIHDIMTLLVQNYELGGYGIHYHDLAKRIDTSRIMLDFNLKKGSELDFFKQNQNIVSLTDQGKFYAIEKGLVEN